MRQVELSKAKTMHSTMRGNRKCQHRMRAESLKYVNFDTFRGICSLTEKGREAIEKKWLFDLKREKKNIRKSKEENKKRILENAEVINY